MKGGNYFMRLSSKLLMLVWGVACFPHVTFGQTIDKLSFEKKMYSVTPISNFGLDPERFAELSDSQKKDILSSRDVLVALMKAIETKSDISNYITPEMNKKYKSSTALAASIVDPETLIMAAGVTDFTFIAGGTDIQLHFFAVTFSEGTIAVSEKSAIVRKVGSNWRIAKFD
jgi:hypothetical protein